MGTITKIASRAAGAATGLDLGELDLPALLAGVTSMQADIRDLRDLMDELLTIERARAMREGLVLDPGVVSS